VALASTLAIDGSGSFGFMGIIVWYFWWQASCTPRRLAKGHGLHLRADKDESGPMSLRHSGYVTVSQSEPR
jgi:hypothetical protein